MRLEDTIDDAGNMMFADSGGVDFDVDAARKFVEADIDDADELCYSYQTSDNEHQRRSRRYNQAEGPRLVKGNNGIYFTDEFKKHVSEMGLPRMRKGGLVSPK